MTVTAWHPDALAVSWDDGAMVVHLDGVRTPLKDDRHLYVVEDAAPTLAEAEALVIEAFGRGINHDDDAAEIRRRVGDGMSWDCSRDVKAAAINMLASDTSCGSPRRVLVSAPSPGERGSPSWRLPLEFMGLVGGMATPFGDAGEPVRAVRPIRCLGDRDDVVLVRGQRDRSGRQLALVDGIRALVVAVEGVTSCEWEMFRTRWRGRGVECLETPSWSGVQRRWKEGIDGRPFNVVALIGHVEPDNGMQTAPEGSRPYERGKAYDLLTRSRLLQELRSEHGALVRSLLLCGCGTWRAFGEAVVEGGVCSAIAHHAKVEAAEQVACVSAFLSELMDGGGGLDEAFVKFRAAGPAHLRGSAVLYLQGFNTQLVARGEPTKERIAMLQGIRGRFRNVETPGGVRERGCSYIPRQLTFVSAPGDEGSPNDPVERRPQQALLDRLKGREEAGQVMTLGVRAPAGSGKTALLERLAFDLAGEALASTCGIGPAGPGRVQLAFGRPEHEVTTTPIPLDVRLRRYGEGGLGRLLEQAANPSRAKTSWWSGCSIAVLADGFDEVPVHLRPDVVTDLREPGAAMGCMRDQARLAAILVSSRPEACEALGGPFFPPEATERTKDIERRTVFGLAAWSREDVEGYLRTSLDGHGGRTAAEVLEHARQCGLSEAMGTPMVTWMLCQMAKAPMNRGLPETETELMHYAIERVLKRHAEKFRESESGLTINVHACLAGIAHVLFLCKLNGDTLRGENARAALKRHFEQWNNRTSGEYPVDDKDRDRSSAYCMHHAGMLETFDDGIGEVVQYTDRRFYDFLVAYHLNQQVARHGWAGTPSS